MTAVEEETALDELTEFVDKAKQAREGAVSWDETGVIWRDGFVAGQADGRELGSSNTKLRVHLALDALEESGALARPVATKIRDALDATLGKRLPR